MQRSPTSKSSTYAPPHWPKNLGYLTAQQYHFSVKKDVLDIIRGQQLPGSGQPPKPLQSFVVIRRITEPSNNPASVFRVYKDERKCPTQPTVSILQAGCGTVRVICGKKDPTTNIFAGLSRQSSLRRQVAVRLRFIVVSHPRWFGQC